MRLKLDKVEIKVVEKDFKKNKTKKTTTLE